MFVASFTCFPHDRPPVLGAARCDRCRRPPGGRSRQTWSARSLFVLAGITAHSLCVGSWWSVELLFISAVHSHGHVCRTVWCSGSVCSLAGCRSIGRYYSILPSAGGSVRVSTRCGSVPHGVALFGAVRPGCERCNIRMVCGVFR